MPITQGLPSSSPPPQQPASCSLSLWIYSSRSHMGGVTHSLSPCDCPTSFSVMSARSIHPTIACWTLPTAGFLLCTAWRTLPCIHIIRLLTCPTVSEYLGCFHVLAIVKKAAMNWSIQLSLWDFVFNSSGHVPRSGSAGSFSYYFFFLRRYCSLSIATVPFVFPTISVQGFWSLHILTNPFWFWWLLPWRVWGDVSQWF